MSAAPKVLVVHDDRDMRAAVGELLRSEGFDVVEAADGLEALLQVKRTRPAGVVLDLVMPRLGGLEAIKRIRAFDRGIKIVVITGASADVVAALRAETVPPAPPESAPSLAVESAPPAPVQSVPAPPVESVPLAPMESAPSTPPPAAPSAAAAASAVPEILVVVGEPGLRGRLEELLAAAGYEVRLMSDAASGVRAVVAKAPHLVLLDVEMPGLSGVGVLPAIVALVPAAKVIMLNESVNIELAKRSLAFGAFDHVTKPIDPPHLLQSIEAALAQRRVDLAG